MSDRYRELVEINHQWNQQYSRLETDSNRVIRQLEVKLRDVEHELASVRRQRDDAKRGGVSSTLVRKADELRVLQGQYDAITGKLEYLQSKYQTALENSDHLEAENRRLKEEKRQKEERGTYRPSDSEQTRLLQHQVGVLRQDLTQERRERERLQRERDILAAEKRQIQDENLALRQQLEQYNPHYNHGRRI